MLRLVVVCALAFPLAGCLSRAIEAKNDAYCQRLGVKVGSDAYVKCRLQLRAEDNAPRGGAVVVQQPQSNPFLDQYKADVARIPQPVPTPSPTSCYSAPTFGGGFTTQCY